MVVNVKQIVVIVTVVIALGLVVFYTPRYKMVSLPNNGFVKAYEGNPLYKNMHAEEKIDWLKTVVFSLPVMIAGALLLWFLRTKEIGNPPVSPDALHQDVPQPPV